MLLRKFSLYTLILLSLYRCASPVTPTGGPKDIIPPVLLSSEPANNLTNQRPTNITFNFNENIQLKNESEKISISPVTLFKIKKKNKSFSIEIEAANLNANTTYSIYFSDCIADLNEGNLYSMDPFIFSTGNNTDSFKISGKINTLITTKSKKYKIHLFTSDDTLIRTPQITDNKFYGTGLQNKPYELLLFNDANGNNKADTIEEKGFIITNPKDSLIINLYPFNKNNINIFKNQNNIYYVSGIVPEDRLTILQDKYWKDTLIADSIEMINVSEKLSKLNSLYITSKNIQNIKRNNRYDIHQSPLNTDSQIIYHFSKNNKDSYNITIIKDSITQKIFTNGPNQVNQNLTGYHQKNKIIVSNQTARTKSDTINIAADKPLPVNFYNKDSVTITLLYTDKYRKNYLYSIRPKSTLTLYTIETSLNILIWHDENNDGRITGPELALKKPGEAFQKISDIKIPEKMELTLNISVYNP